MGVTTSTMKIEKTYSSPHGEDANGTRAKSTPRHLAAALKPPRREASLDVCVLQVV